MSLGDESAELRELLYLVPVGLARVGLDGTILMLNPHATALLMLLVGEGTLVNLFELLGTWVPELRGLIRQREPGARGIILQHRRIAVPGARGERAWLELTVTQPVPTDLIVVITDVTDLVRKEQQLSLLARIDSLTGLLNRRAMSERLEEAIAHRSRQNQPLSLLFIDIDRFKAVNDNYGHEAGDEVLIAFGAALRRCGRQDDALCRWGGEEFAVLCLNTDKLRAVHLADRILSAMRAQTVTAGQVEISVTCSVGVAEHVEAESGADLLKRADDALYRAKQTGRDRACVS